MIPSLKSLTTSILRLFLVLVMVALTPLQLQAAELKVELKLVWGTNGKTSSNPKHKRVTGTVPSRGTNKFVMSKDCTIEIKEMEGPNVEVKLIGEGKDVVKATHHLTKGETINLASECKDGNAWFVLVTELDEK